MAGAPFWNRVRIVVRYAPQWFIAVFAAVYLTGYLIDYFYYSSLGITESGADLLKLHYVVVGLTFFLFVAIVAGPSWFDVIEFFSRFFGMDSTTTEVQQLSVRAARAFLDLVYGISVYFAFIFTPSNYFSFPDNEYRLYWVLGIIFFVQTISVLVTDYSERQMAAVSPDVAAPVKGFRSACRACLSLNKYQGYQITAYVFLALVTIAYSCYIFYPLRAVLNELFIVKEGYVFIILSVLLGLNIWHAIGHSANAPGGFSRYTIVAGTSALLILYLTIFSYAYSVFPSIPNSKGGGDFTGAPNVSLVLIKPSESTGYGNNQSTPVSGLILLYRSTQELYFAHPYAGNDACTWRRGIAPNLITLKAADIFRITITPLFGRLTNCIVPQNEAAQRKRALREQP